MNYRRLAIAILFAVCAQVSYADSIPTFHITEAIMLMGPNDGSGDNLSFSFTGPGVIITGIGGMGCFDWCSGLVSEPFGAASQVYVSLFQTVIIGGISYDQMDVFFNSLFADNGGLNASTNGFVGEGYTFQEIRMTAPNGYWNFTFVDAAAPGDPPAYYFTEGHFYGSATVPEPGTIGLVLTGLAGIAKLARSNAKFRH